MSIFDLIGMMAPEAFRFVPELFKAIIAGDVRKAERSAKAAAQATAGRNETIAAAKAAKKLMGR